MSLYHIKHITKYTYSDNVVDGTNQIRLYPLNNEFQKVISQHIVISGNPNVHTYKDFFNNTIGVFMRIEPHNYLSIISDIEIITHPVVFPKDTAKPSEQWEVLKSLKLDTQFLDYLKCIAFNGTSEISQILLGKDKLTPYKLAIELCEYVYTNFTYIQGITNVHSKLDEVWQLKAGVCQDFTNVLLQMVRMAGIPARYVSGYICPSDSKTRGEGATHAWIEVYIPYYGWLGLDPTNNIIVSEHHVKLAVGRNYKDCAPVNGVYKGDVTDSLFVKVHVSTTKTDREISISSSDAEKSKPIKREGSKNSYRENLAFIQQQQQQQ
ncbi:transglutaminase family protein [Flavobacteriaceae bacterium MHTCC 0001]